MRREVRERKKSKHVKNKVEKSYNRRKKMEKIFFK